MCNYQERRSASRPTGGRQPVISQSLAQFRRLTSPAPQVHPASASRAPFRTHPNDSPGSRSDRTPSARNEVTCMQACGQQPGASGFFARARARVSKITYQLIQTRVRGVTCGACVCVVEGAGQRRGGGGTLEDGAINHRTARTPVLAAHVRKARGRGSHAARGGHSSRGKCC